MFVSGKGTFVLGDCLHLFFYRLWLRTLQRACHVPGYAWREFLFGITFGLASVCLKEVLGYRHVTRHGEICIKCKEHKALAAEAAYPNPPKKKPPPDLFIVGLRETRLPRGEPRTSKCTIDAPRDSSELNSPCFYGLCIPYWTWEASPLLHPRDLRLLTQKTTDCPGPSAPPPWEREGWSGSGRPRSPQRMVSTLCYEAGRVGCKRGDGITIYLYYNGRLMDSTRGVANDDRLFVIPLKNIDE